MLAAHAVWPSSCRFRTRRSLAGTSCYTWSTRALGGCKETRKKGRRLHGRESRASFIDQGAKSRWLCAYHRPIRSAALDVMPIGPHPFLGMSGYYPLVVSDTAGRRRRLPIYRLCPALFEPPANLERRATNLHRGPMMPSTASIRKRPPPRQAKHGARIEELFPENPGTSRPSANISAAGKGSAKIKRGCYGRSTPPTRIRAF